MTLSRHVVARSIAFSVSLLLGCCTSGRAEARLCQETNATPVLGHGKCYRFGSWDDDPFTGEAGLMIGIEPSMHALDLSARTFDVTVVQNHAQKPHSLDGPALGIRRIYAYGDRLTLEALRLGPFRLGPYVELEIGSLAGTAPWLLDGHAYQPSYAYSVGAGFAPSIALPWGPLLLRVEAPMGLAGLVLDTRDEGPRASSTAAALDAPRPPGLAAKSSAVSGNVGHGPPPDGCSAWSFHGVVAARLGVEAFVDRYWTIGAYASADLVHRDDWAAGLTFRAYYWPWAGTH
jgi:hypothetical protein